MSRLDEPVKKKNRFLTLRSIHIPNPTFKMSNIPSQNRHKRRHVQETDENAVIDLTADTPDNKRVAIDSTKRPLAKDETKALSLVIQMIRRVYDDANERSESEIGDTPVPNGLIEVADELNRLFVDQSASYLSAISGRYDEVGARQSLRWMTDKEDHRAFSHLLRAVAGQEE
jgi:hypothetical protein